MQRRFDPNFARIKQALVNGEVWGSLLSSSSAPNAKPCTLTLTLILFVTLTRPPNSYQVGEPIVIKLCSRDPEPPPFEYVKGGGGIFKDMAIHDLDMARLLMNPRNPYPNPDPNPDPNPSPLALALILPQPQPQPQPELVAPTPTLTKARFLMDSEPVEILASGSCNIDKSIEVCMACAWHVHVHVHVHGI